MSGSLHMYYYGVTISFVEPDVSHLLEEVNGPDGMNQQLSSRDNVLKTCIAMNAEKIKLEAESLILSTGDLDDGLNSDGLILCAEDEKVNTDSSILVGENIKTNVGDLILNVEDIELNTDDDLPVPTDDSRLDMDCPKLNMKDNDSDIEGLALNEDDDDKRLESSDCVLDADVLGLEFGGITIDQNGELL